LSYGNTVSGRWLPIFDGVTVNGATTEYSNLHMKCYSEYQAFNSMQPFVWKVWIQ